MIENKSNSKYKGFVFIFSSISLSFFLVYFLFDYGQLILPVQTSFLPKEDKDFTRFGHTVYQILKTSNGIFNPFEAYNKF